MSEDLRRLESTDQAGGAARLDRFGSQILAVVGHQALLVANVAADNVKQSRLA